MPELSDELEREIVRYLATTDIADDARRAFERGSPPSLRAITWLEQG